MSKPDANNPTGTMTISLLRSVHGHAVLSELGPVPARYAPMEHHKRGLQWTRTGYGGRIPTPYMIRIPDKRGVLRWHRVYVAQWSNSGTAYVETGPVRVNEHGRKVRDWLVVND